LSSIVFPALDVHAENKWTNLVEESGKVLADIQQMPDQGHTEDLMKSLPRHRDIPNTVSGGFVIGGKIWPRGHNGCAMMKPPGNGRRRPSSP